MSEAPGTSTFERDDIELVKLFLSRFKDRENNSYKIESRPDATEHNAKAIDCIALAENGTRLGIEHTSIHPFEGKKADDVPFLAVFEQLGTDLSLRVPNRFTEIYVPVSAVPKGVVWKDVGPKVRDWLRASKDTFLPEGNSRHLVPGLGFKLEVVVQTMVLPDSDGRVIVGRQTPPGDPLTSVLKKALATKVPKLVATLADKRILLLEDEGVSIGFTKVIQLLDETVHALSDLTRIDAVWCVHTMSWKSSGALFFFHIWPGGVQERFTITDPRFSEKKTDAAG
jgi:hypothetical protein